MSEDEKKSACCSDHHHCGMDDMPGTDHVHDHSGMKLLPVIGSETAAAGATSMERLSRGAVYRIIGMDCSSCAKSLEKHMKSIAAVQEVSVNFSTGKMQIVQQGLSDEAIVSEVSKAGYAASPLSRGRGQKTEQTDGVGTRLAVISGILLALGFLGSFTSIPEPVLIVCYALSMIVGGYRPARSAFYAIKSGSLDMNVLMSVAAIGAALIGEWLEGATVVWLFAIGNWLQTNSIEKTRDSIRTLMDLAPAEAWVKQGASMVRLPVEDVGVGDVIVVKPGEKVPLDGEILAGVSSINQAPITGESIPVDKQVGDFVFAGSVNESGSLEVRVTRLVDDTAIAKIIHLVEEAQEKKAPTQAFVDKFAALYTPIVLVLALLVIVFPPLFGWGTWGDWFYKGLELLVVACPCALVISTPVAIVSAIGNAARNGVLIKGGTFLEKAGAITAIAFDKTGTLTVGKPQVSQIVAASDKEDEVLAIARTIEEHSRHPIAQAILAYANEKMIASLVGQDFRVLVGKGAEATIDGEIYFAGKPALFSEKGVSLTAWTDQIESLQQEGNTIVMIGTSQAILGMIAVSDKIRDISVGAISKLKAEGIDEIVMLTGDNQGTAAKVAKLTGVSRYFAELLPEDKVAAIKKLQQEGKTVAMVGDGINDAPALATADLGIAMGGAGTDTAMETADIVLMADNLEKLPHTVNISRKALQIIQQNIWFSIIVKLVALILIFPGWLTLWLAVLSDTGAALIVILNSMRLLRMK
ncbi:heavy metal translocating P-type ATPase [Brevibacillus choshinensis]|uniref:heavy metal translocating P-type ATPase n=1 Tax=Brevibacillus choshinensis TaxID=54911 RepID=UPI002E1C9F8B|nr:heavy metal translocating P-type ATPase [Brevibacillus choshinensis]